MKKIYRKAVKDAGWRVGTVRDFLELSEAENALVELRLALSNSLREQRARHRITQKDLAELLGSSQSRVAKMESGDPSVSLDLLIWSHLALGATNRDLARTIGRPVKKVASAPGKRRSQT